MADEKVVEVMATAMYQSLIDGKRSFSATGLCMSAGQVDLKSFSKAALAALEKEGYAVVPVKPTEAMIKAGGAALQEYVNALSDEERAKLKSRKTRQGDMLGYKLRPDVKCGVRWAAMLAASGVVHEQESYTAALSDPPKE